MDKRAKKGLGQPPDSLPEKEQEKEKKDRENTAFMEGYLYAIKVLQETLGSIKQRR